VPSDGSSEDDEPPAGKASGKTTAVVATTRPAAVTAGDFDTLVAATKLPPATTRWADYPADEDDDNYLDGLCWRQAPQKPTGRPPRIPVDANKMPSSTRTVRICSPLALLLKPHVAPLRSTQGRLLHPLPSLTCQRDTAGYPSRRGQHCPAKIVKGTCGLFISGQVDHGIHSSPSGSSCSSKCPWQDNDGRCRNSARSGHGWRL
jgi:hypothetical protein